MNKTSKQTLSKTVGGYNAALAVPGHGLYALLVLILAPQIGLVPATLLVVVPYMYVSAKVYQRQQTSDYKLRMATQKPQARSFSMPKLRLTPLLNIKKPKPLFAMRQNSTKATLFSH